MSFRSATFWAAAVLVACSGCAPGMQVTRIAPAYYNLGNTRRVAVLEVTGEPQAMAQVLTDLQQKVIDDRYYQLVVATDRGATFTVSAQGGFIEIGEVRRLVEADVYLNAHVRHYDYREVEKVENKVTRYQPEAKVRVNFQVVKADGRVIVFRDYEGTASAPAFDAGKRPSRPPTAVLDDAIREAVRRFTTDITPHQVYEKIVFDDATEDLKPGIKLAEAGDLAGAERAWADLVAKNPSNAGAIYNIGVLLETRGEFEQAAAHYNQAISLLSKPLYQSALENMNRRLAETQSLNQGI